MPAHTRAPEHMGRSEGRVPVELAAIRSRRYPWVVDRIRIRPMLSLRSICGILAIFVLAVPGKASAQTAPPGTTLSWNRVRHQPGFAFQIDPACEQPGASHRLFATFTSDTDIPDFVGIEAT